MVSVALQLACCKALLVLLVQFTENCLANQLNSCGNLNIKDPFRFGGDSDKFKFASCLYQFYTLACENNRTVMQLYSRKYNVQAINYTNKTVRLVDASTAIDNCSSLPLYEVTPNDFFQSVYLISQFASPILVVKCENPVKSPIYISSTANNCSEGYFYGLVGNVTAGDLEDSCTIKTTTFSSSRLLYDYQRESKTNISFSDIQKGINYGFEVTWGRQSVISCRILVHRSLWELIQLLFYPPYFYYHGNYDGDWRSNIPLGLFIVGLIIGARTLCVPCVFGFLIYKYRRRHLSMYDSVEGFLRSQNNLMPISYSYSDLKKMTKGFSEKLGEGGYGSVYKGKLRSGRFVAIKMLSKPKSDGQEFINEVATIGRIHHVNVVHLIGYCAKRSNRALVYDFMPNGSLEKYIFSREDDSSLSFQQIYEISLGVARGIEYLHQGCDMQILHFDIKPHNILLDENFIPKVSDFGLAKLYPTDYSIVPLTAARGTLGYMAPELFYKNIGGVSYKADVYSFGMLLMEMASKRRNWNGSAESSQIFFPSWVYNQFIDGKNIEMEEITEDETERVKKMMMVALWCIQMKPSDRPSMKKVVEMLEGSIENLEMPPKPFLYPQDMPAENQENKKLPNLSGACMDAVTLDFSGR